MPSRGAVDPTPLSPAQIRALAAAAARELSWGLRAAGRELAQWRVRADAIPDTPLRRDALDSLTHKRGHADGAALFTILPRRRNPQLLRLLVAFETIVDFLDTANERHATPANGMQLHRAVLDALDPGRPLGDYYRFHPWRDDGGYLLALIGACREGCQTLPSFEHVRALLRQETRRALVLGLNHEPDPQRRTRLLQTWAAREHPDERELSWFELGGAGSATLLLLVLLTLASDASLTEPKVADVYAAYWPWLPLATTMLDSYVDRAEDETAGAHSYIAYYPDDDAALDRLHEAIRRSMAGVRRLRDGHLHAVIVGCMIGLYLSRQPTRSPTLHATTRDLARSGGSLARLLVPILRTWRACGRQDA